MFMVDIETIIRPFIRALNRGEPIEELLIPILAENPNVEATEVTNALLSHRKSVVREIKPVSSSLKPSINGERYKTDMTTKEYDKLRQSLKNIVEIVDKSDEGITKTGILQALRRDGSYWRPKITRWLLHLCDDGVIQSDNNRLNPRYYSYDAHVHNREREIHRRVVESLQIHGQMTMTQLAIKIGRNGGSNRSQVSQALDDLEREGFVRRGQRNRWACFV